MGTAGWTGFPTGLPDDPSIAAWVEDFVGLRAEDPGLDPEVFSRRCPEAVRDEVHARCRALLIFGAGAPTADDVLLFDAAAGHPLGDFRLIRELGRGGMGVVFLAEQVSLRREVAVKVLPAHLARDVHSVESFHREASAAARLRHPGIVAVHTVGEDRGVHYFAMDYVRGASLQDRIDARRAARRTGAELEPLAAARDRGPTAEAADLAAQVAEALQYAHDRGVVHRDVKPQNILLSEDGTARLVDFGLAKELGLATVTVSGQLKGTPVYMSPEQVRGRRSQLDHRTDVYSLGVVLYEMLTLQRPFAGAGLAEVLRQIAVREPTPARKLNPSVPRDLETVCHKAMAKQPRRRYATAAELAADLRRFLRLEPVHASPPGPASRAFWWARRHKSLTAAACVAVLALATHFVVRAMERARALGEARLEMSRARSAQREGRMQDAVSHIGRAENLLPDDVAVRETRDSYQKRWLLERRLRFERSEIELLSEPSLALLLAIDGVRRSPEQLANSPLANGALLAALRVNRETRTLLGHRAAVLGASIGPGDRLAVTAAADWTARIWEVETGRELLVLDGHQGAVHAASFDCAGTAVVTASADRTARIWAVLDGRSIATLRGHAAPVRWATFSADGRQVATAGEDGTARIWDVATGEEQRCLGGHEQTLRCASFSSDGRLLVTAGDRTVRVWDLSTGRSAFARSVANNVMGAVFHPADDRLVLFCSGRGARIWHVGEDRQVAEFVESGHGEHVVSVAFRADGRRVATGSWDGTAIVWDVLAQTPVVELRGHRRHVRSVAFDAGGERLITASEDRTARVWDVREDPATRIPRVFAGGVATAAFSPDGTRLATSSSGEGWIRVYDVASGNLVAELRATDTTLLPPASFGPDGQRVLAPAADHTARILGVADGREVVLEGHGDLVTSVTFDPTGRRVATASLDGTTRVFDASTGREERRFAWADTRSVWFVGAGAQLCGTPAARIYRPGGGPWGDELPMLAESSVVLASVRDGRIVREFRGAWVHQATPSEDGERLILATATSPGGEAWLLDAATGARVSSLGDGAPQHAAFSRDGRFLALAMFENAVLVFDARTGDRLATLAHDRTVACVDFSPDASRVVTACFDQTARIWSKPARADERAAGRADERTEEWTEECTLRGHNGRVVWCAFGPRGRWVATVADDWKARVWPASPSAAAERSKPRDLTLEERGRLGFWSDVEEDAHRLVEQLFETLDVLADVEARLREDPGLDDAVRAAALRFAHDRGDRPWELADRAWSTVRDPSCGPVAAQAALRRARAALSLFPDHADLHRVVGAAGFRVGRYAEALPYLEPVRDDETRAAATLAFLAMTYHHLRRHEQASAVLRRFEALDPATAEPEAAALAREARALCAQRDGPAGR